MEELNPERVILFGSFVKGNVHKSSDVDLIIAKDIPSKFLERLDRVYKILNPDFPNRHFSLYSGGDRKNERKKIHL